MDKMNNFTNDQITGPDIAVVGMSGRFPGAQNVNDFWKNLSAGVESIRFPSDQELEALGVEPAILREPNYVKAVAMMDGVEFFDAAFFGYTPREAELMDPQQRIFLECAWEALEHAGYDPERYRGAIGMFGGGTTNTYMLFNLMSNRESLGAFDPMQIDVSNATDFFATRVSYKLNLRGPSFTIQTACSTALVAIHTACQSLLNEECDMALAGGVSVHVKHNEGYWHLDGGNVSPDGHCRAFDAKGAGTIFGSGVGMVVLKRLEDALTDRDHIYAVIKGSAINNDGSMKVGFTAPSVDGQAGVIKEALAIAGISPDTIRYVETHGTATALGDPIEIRALSKAFRAQTDARNFCAIGSVKSNIGHMASAAGAAGMIKTLLMLEHRLIAPSLHFEQPNPEIDFENSPFYVNTKPVEWERKNGPRRAGVSSFGVGGTNAHLILEEAPRLEPSSPSRPAQLLLLSAKTDNALGNATTNLVSHLKEHTDLNLADVAYTLQVGRQAFRHRRIVVCRNQAEAVDILSTPGSPGVFSGISDIQKRPVVFMFPGAGDQYIDMALELYQAEPTFRKTVDRCAAFIKPLIGLDLREVLYPNGTQPRKSSGEAPAVAGTQIDLRKMLRRGDEPSNGAVQQINQTSIVHPLLFTIEYALAKLWMEWGVRPQAMIGHSLGEYVAACLAGIFSLEDALTLVVKRAQMIQALPGGSMLAVLLPSELVQARMNGHLSMAAINTPTACVVSGPTDAVVDLERQLLEDGVACQRVQTQHAFHSTMMTPIVEPFRELLSQITLHPPTIPVSSNVTGDWITSAEATDPDYWAKHMCQTVRFANGLQSLLRQPHQVLLEMGPGQTLTALVKQHPEHTLEHVVLASLRQPHQSHSDVGFILNTLGRLWLAGVEIHWPGFYAHEERDRLPLPTYPFERQRYWIDAKAASVGVPAPIPANLDRKTQIADWFYTPTWKRSLSPAFKPQANQPANKPVSTVCLVFEDRGSLAAGLAKQLAQTGYSVIQIRSGEQFVRLSNDLYTINPRQRDDYLALFTELATCNQLPGLILHCTSLTYNLPASAILAFNDFQDTGFNSLSFLAQALEEQNMDAPLQLWVISNHVCQVESADVIYSEKASLLSPCKVLPQEYPNITCRYVDISLDGSEARLVDQLFAEIQTHSDESVIAYRGHQRWIQSFEPLRLEENAQPIYPLRENGVYVITEGLVGVGWALAQYLAQTIKARLVLIEPLTFPEQSQWPQWLESHDAQDDTRRKILRVRQLEENGTPVLVLSANMVDPAHMQQAFSKAANLFGELHGVIHALDSAGGGGFRPIQDLGSAESEQPLAHTVQSLFALAQAASKHEFDFCILTSSLSSVLGGLGQATHAATSLIMDATAGQQSQLTRTPWVSIDWDVWLSDGEMPGMALNASLAQFAITPADGVEVARRILTRLPDSQIVISTGDLSARMKQRPHTLAPKAAESEALRSIHPRPQLSVPYVAPRTELEHTIAHLWQEVFGLEQIGIDDNFFELGGNSLIAIHSMSRLKKVLHVDVLTSSLYQRPTVRFLAELLAQDEEQAAQQLAEKLAKRKTELGRRNQIVQRRRA